MGSVKLAKRLLFTLALGSILALPAAAHASSVAATSGTLTMSSDPGDYIGQGLSYSYATPDATFWTHGDAMFYDGNMVQLSVYSGSDWWSLGFQAPTGQKLTPGMTYTNAVRGLQSAPPPGALPRMDIYGNGRGCNTLTGSFTVLDVAYGPYGYLQSFHATFEQHCEGAAAALRGEVNVTAPPAPAAQAFHLTIDPSGVAARPGGQAIVHGTITCTSAATIYFDANVAQQTKKGALISGTAYGVSANCSGSTPSPWSATVPSSNGSSFTSGDATVQASGSVFDSYYTQYLGQNPIYAYESESATVRLQMPHG